AARAAHAGDAGGRWPARHRDRRRLGLAQRRRGELLRVGAADERGLRGRRHDLDPPRVADRRRRRRHPARTLARLAAGPRAALPLRPGLVAVGGRVRRAARGAGAALPQRGGRLAGSRTARHGASAVGSGPVGDVGAGEPPRSSCRPARSAGSSDELISSSSSPLSGVSSGDGGIGRSPRMIAASTACAGHSTAETCIPTTGASAASVISYMLAPDWWNVKIRTRSPTLTASSTSDVMMRGVDTGTSTPQASSNIHSFLGLLTRATVRGTAYSVFARNDTTRFAL